MPDKTPTDRISWRDPEDKYHREPGEGRRAYADFRDYAAEGGGREALKPPGASRATTDPVQARDLVVARLGELQRKRDGRMVGHAQRHTTLRQLVSEHLVKKRDAGTSRSHLIDLEHRLREAVAFFGQGRNPRTIEPADVRAWSEALSERPGRDGTMKPGSVRHYLNALSGLYRSAIEGLFVDPGYNPVAMMTHKPTGRWKGEAAFFDVAEAALLLEAARVVERRDRVNATPGLYAIIAAFLLTGGRRAEVLGLDVEDVSFYRGVVRFRPNPWRGLKTQTSHRDVPLWPQLAEALQVHMYGGASPRTSGLLFPAPHGGMVRDLRKSLDAMGELCGLDAGAVRTKAFRHTYCSTRLTTVQRIVKPGRDPATDPDPYEWLEVPRFTVEREMGHGGGQLVQRIYGHVQRGVRRSEVVEYRVNHYGEELGERLRALDASVTPH